MAPCGDRCGLAGAARLLYRLDAHAGAGGIGADARPARLSECYRFSRAAVEEVFLEECEDRRVIEAMDPPRLIGVGRKA